MLGHGVADHEDEADVARVSRTTRGTRRSRSREREEVLVLRGQDGLAHDGRDLVVFEDAPIFARELDQHLAPRVGDLADRRGSKRMKGLEVGYAGAVQVQVMRARRRPADQDEARAAATRKPRWPITGHTRARTLRPRAPAPARQEETFTAAIAVISARTPASPCPREGCDGSGEMRGVTRVP